MKARFDIVQRNVAFAFVGISAIVLLLLFPYSPLQDFPQWIYQGFVFNSLVSGHDVGHFFLKSYPVPYATAQILISASLLLFSPMVTSKLIVVGYFVLSFWVSRRLVRRFDLDPKIAWPLLISIFVLNSPFWNGYLGYQLGLIVFATYLSLSDEARTDSRVLVAFSVLAFFCHGMTYVAFMVAAGACAIARRRIIGPLIGVTPSIALVIWYVACKTPSPPPDSLPSLGFVGFIGYKAYSLLKLGPYQNFVIRGIGDAGRLASTPLILGILANIAFGLGLSMRCVSATKWREWPTLLRIPELLCAIVLLAFWIVLTPIALKIVNPGERLLYPAVLAIATRAFRVDRVSSMDKIAHVGRLLLSSAFVAGFFLSAVGLISSTLAYRRSSFDTISERLDWGDSYGLGALSGERLSQTLFVHRLIQFDRLMKETESAWRTGATLNIPLEFDTALVGQSNPAPPNP